jgi:hypothetical protein
MPDLADLAHASAAADAADMGVTTRHCLGKKRARQSSSRCRSSLERKWNRISLQPLIDKLEYS